MYEISKDSTYLVMLQKQFPDRESACNEIINLKAILNLPKPTEHFISDIHGEHKAFVHMIKNCSGVIKNKINNEFSSTLSPVEKEKLAICISYPEETIIRLKEQDIDINAWYKKIIQEMIIVCRVMSRKYSRSKVRKALPSQFQYIMEELLHETEHDGNKDDYYKSIIDSIIEVSMAADFIIAISEVIQRLAIDKLHVVGDIFDRGPGPHLIIDELMKYHSVDIQWGNHDIVWMGAACGSEICIANIIRVCARYGHLDILEDGYGINLRQLASFANKVYGDDDCECFKTVLHNDLQKEERMLLRRMHKAISIIQFKLEGQLVQRNPLYEMDSRLLLEKITEDKKHISINGELFELADNNLPTVDLSNPYKLTDEEESLIKLLKKLCLRNEKMYDHLEFLLRKGGMYLKFNSNLLIHGCIPMEKNGSFAKVSFFGEELSGERVMKAYENWVHKSFNGRLDKDNDTDLFWYLWSGKNSPLFGKTEMKTFERYLIKDKSVHKEEVNPYYEFWQNEEIIDKILKEFDIDSDFAHIINGHMPVRALNGENPIKANGKLIVIDGGLNPIYNPITGTAGYTLIFNSFGLTLAAHEKFESKETILEKGKDIMSYYGVCDEKLERINVAQTDTGDRIKLEIEALNKLCELYSTGQIKEL